MDKQVWKITEGTKHIWKIRWQSSKIEKRKDDPQKHIQTIKKLSWKLQVAMS